MFFISLIVIKVDFSKSEFGVGVHKSKLLEIILKKTTRFKLASRRQDYLNRNHLDDGCKDENKRYEDEMIECRRVGNFR